MLKKYELRKGKEYKTSKFIILTNTKEECCQHIYFLENGKISYLRMYNNKLDDNLTTIDYGSHTQFYFIKEIMESDND